MNERTSILVVDENNDSCTMMAALLGQVGYAAETSRSVGDALKLAHDTRPALYVIDSYYSDGRGSELCRQIAALDPQAMIIFYSCAFGTTDFEEALRAGADAYVVKPGIDELLHTITSLIDQIGPGQPALLSI